ncbi:hypothetical protein F2Q70_00010362 [Brassica cretica]|uniref:Uncharacterized protein n=1 Tax=Brassica cretica TaxID=69181 RepID=A0A3N6S128_BRACR|nr:hypothetical protein F2Q70_00010362 [Brassica cretica]KAF3543727.1 hypothetical protein DY000_02004971 [Brassica cretica]
MPVKNHKALERMDQSSERLIPHTYTKGSKGRKEQPEGEHYPNLRWQTWRKDGHKDVKSDESFNEIREHRWKGRQNEIIKSWSRPRAIEVRSPKTIS